MGIEKFIEKVCVQTAVYWGSPIADGYGGYTFDDAEEIDCRWEDRTQIVINQNGEEVTSNAEILVTEDLDLRGYLYLGELDDLSTAEQADPMTVSGAYRIISKSKIPMIKSTSEFVRKVFV